MISISLQAVSKWRTRHGWIDFLARRLLRMAASVLVLVTITFAILHLIPGDPVRGALGPQAPAAVVAAQREALGLNNPLWKQYLDFIGGVVHGDFGISLVSQLPVGDAIAERFMNTLGLAISAFLVTVLISLSLGATMAILTKDGRRRRTEATFTSATGILGSIPEFLSGVGLVFFFAVLHRWLPVAGKSGPSSYILPVFALALAPVAALSRVVRVEMIKVLSQDYMRTARSKRLPSWMIYLRHALPNMLTAALTIGGLVLASLVTGSVLVEKVFAWPGLGTIVVNAILAKDYPTVQAAVLLLGLLVLGVNLLVDLALALLDPRSTMKDA